MAQTADAGRMIDVLVIERRSVTVGPDGTESETWVDAGVIRGEPMTIIDDESRQGAVRMDMLTRRWRIWWTDQLTLRDRLRDGRGQRYHIRRIDDPTGRQRHLIVTCEEAAP